jgi:hypothetical protein
LWTDIGTVTNNTNPSAWESEAFDVLPLLPGHTSALLGFGLRNDWNSPGTTVSRVEFGVDGINYFVRLSYSGGDDTSHWRNVTLNLDGVLYVDQYGAFNDHLGDELLGTAQQGGLGEPAIYVLQLDGSSVPEPGSLALLGAAITALALRRTGRPK